MPVGQARCVRDVGLKGSTVMKTVTQSEARKGKPEAIALLVAGYLYYVG
jgi:orotate phosphoribosyltransferase-like protein